MSDAPKGTYGGRCNRTACGNHAPAIWWSSVERAYYCRPCARKINEALPPGVPPLVESAGPRQGTSL